MFAATIDPKHVLWTYIVLLVVGGLIGFLRAGSKVSLIASGVFAVALVLCVTGVITEKMAPTWIMLGVGAVFTFRLIKTRKFMPSGLMLLLTALALAALHLKF